MGNVDVNEKSLLDIQKKINDNIKLLEQTISSLDKNCQQFNDTWHDSKCNDLVNIIQMCKKELNKILVVLSQNGSTLSILIQSLQEYDNVSFNANLSFNGRSQILQMPKEDNSDIVGDKNIPNWRMIFNDHDVEYDLKNTNPNYDKGKKWKINCQRCVPTYEMRRRGYDVTAIPSGIFSSSYISYHPFEVWENAVIHNCNGSGLNDIKNAMNEWGDGARAQIVVVWNNTNIGHTFIAEQIDGVTRFIDPQTNENNVEYYFNSVSFGETQFCRIDNLEVSNRIEECCEEI